ncbi:RagB/SusD family nutrient uptake outer membrane protein [Draconibacterium orientale]|uniref:RagB/SusD family nutrient uptake outer membrane protein n=1 Tax=Draconibacterium orientale TaxID=1168034 RepID=UPI002ABEA101|nr:RagB/SusD family nutrient uptake outer membrane protein [Draconibacterium orientale]
MKNIFRNITIYITICLLSVSCSDLDQEIYSELAVDSYDFTADDMNKLIAPAYSSFANVILGFHPTLTQSICTDQIAICSNASGWDDGGVFKRMQLHTWNAEQSHVAEEWNSYYRAITNVNRVLDQLDQMEAISDELRKAYTSELRAVRAYSYWRLVDQFMEMPLVTSFSDTELPSPVSRQEVYNFVESELLEIIPNLSEENNPTTYGRFNKWAAHAVLVNLYLNAKVYTGTAQWSKCIEHCDSIINSGKYSLEPDYSNCFKVENERSSELILAVPCDDVIKGTMVHMISLHASIKAKYQMDDTPWGAGGAKGITQWLDTYDEADKRLAASWEMGPQFAKDGSPLLGVYEKQGEPLVFSRAIPNSLHTNEMHGYRVGKYEIIPGTKWILSNDIPVFRYSAILLAKAECLLRTGLAGAGTLVTQVRNRAFDNTGDAQVTDAELAQDSKYRYGYYEKDYGYDVALWLESGESVDAKRPYGVPDEVYAAAAGANVADYFNETAADLEDVEFGRMLDEWGWEMSWEFTRRMDLIRFGVFTTKQWASHKPNGGYRTTFPIPQSALDANSNLKQTAGY